MWPAPLSTQARGENAPAQHPRARRTRLGIHAREDRPRDEARIFAAAGRDRLPRPLAFLPRTLGVGTRASRGRHWESQEVARVVDAADPPTSLFRLVRAALALAATARAC